MFLDNNAHQDGSFYLDCADKGIKGLAVIVGGLWTYVVALRSGVFKRKLEPKVNARIFKVISEYFIVADCKLKNVGQSKYPIRQTGTAVTVVSLKNSGRGKPVVSAVFKKHGWIEPGEEVEESLIFPIPDPQEVVAFEVNLRVVSDTELTPNAIEWNASCVVSSYFPQKASESSIS